MGRPVKKSRFGDTANGGDQLQFKAYVNGSAVDSYVVSQRGTRKYNFKNGANTAICTLVNKASGSLAAGEASMVVTPFSGNVGYASKLTQKTVTTFASSVKGGILTVTLGSGGTGYTVGDVLTVAGGAGAGGKLTVLTAPGGIIGTVSVSTAGTNYLVSDALTVTGGTGANNATFTVATVYAAPATYKWISSTASGVTTITSASVAGEATLVKA